MTEGTPPPLLARLSTAVLSIPLRFKITIPFLLVSLLLAGVATLLVSQSYSRALQERFRSQLTDAAAGANDELFQAETSQLAAVRAISQTNGVAEATGERNWKQLDALIRPIVVNYDIKLIHIVDQTGFPLYGLRALPQGFAENENAPFSSWDPVARVLRQESDDLGDKFSAVVSAPWGVAIYTAAPIRLNGQLVGAVLVGDPMADILASMQNFGQRTLTAYRPNGQAAVSTAKGNSTANLDGQMLANLTQPGGHLLRSRSIILAGASNTEAVGALFLRARPSGWFVGVALPATSLVTQLSPTEVAGWFTLGILAVIALGVVVAQLVAVPVNEMVKASALVAKGEFDVQVREHARDELGVLAERFNWMARELGKRDMMHEVFGQVVSEEVREALMGGKVGLGGELKTVTVLFTDIRDFTSLAESYDPREVVTLLNDYFEVVTTAIQSAGGFINKFGGDSTMAVFGAPLEAPPQLTAHRALQSAFAIRTRLAEFNARQIERGRPPIRIGIGINTGEVVTGNIGSKDRYEYTVIGDTVNTAARVQSLTSRFTDSNILITEDTRQALGKDAQLLVIDHGDVALKGKMKLVRVYGVMGMRFTEAEPVFHIGGIPRRDVLEALYLYCRGFSPRIIGLAKNADPLVVHQWVEGAARLYDRSSEELRQEFGLTDVELNRLAANARRLSEPMPTAAVENGNGSGPA